MTPVWVVTEGTDNEGDTVLGVFTSPETGKASVEMDASPLEWEWHGDCWFSRKPGDLSITSYEVRPWDLDLPRS